RISSVAYEVPALGNYLITIGPWMFSYILTEKKAYKFIPSTIVLALMYFSDSRTALICILIEFMVFVLILLHDVRYRKTTSTLLKLGATCMLIILLVNSVTIVGLI